MVLDVSELAPDPASWTFHVASGTFEHLVGGCNHRLKCEACVEHNLKGLNECEVKSDGAWHPDAECTGGEVGCSDSWADLVALIARSMRIGWESDFLSNRASLMLDSVRRWLCPYYENSVENVPGISISMVISHKPSALCGRDRTAEPELEVVLPESCS